MSRIVTNQCLMRLRRLRPARFLSLDTEPANTDLSPREVPDLSPSPEAVYGSAQVADLLQNEIGRLPQILRQVVILRDIEERTTADTAAVLEITESAVKSRLRRARSELRTRLQPLV